VAQETPPPLRLLKRSGAGDSSSSSSPEEEWRRRLLLLFVSCADPCAESLWWQQMGGRLRGTGSSRLRRRRHSHRGPAAQSAVGHTARGQEREGSLLCPLSLSLSHTQAHTPCDAVTEERGGERERAVSSVLSLSFDAHAHKHTHPVTPSQEVAQSAVGHTARGPAQPAIDLAGDAVKRRLTDPH
jgi:hypothetical protein